MGAEQTTTPPALTAAQMATIDPETDDTMGQSIPITESRLFDLVRYARYWLQDEHVISMGEWTWLTMSATGEGAGSVSRNRLEENDRLRAAYTTAQARIEALEGEVSTSRRAFGAISLAVAAIDKGSDNTPWQDVVARIEAIGAEMSRRLLGPSFEFVEEVRAECREWKRRASHAKRHKVKAQALARQAESALTAARTRAEGLETDLHAVASHNRELLLHLAEAQANLNDTASKLAVEDARTTRQAKTIRALEAVIREYLDALDVASNHVMRTDDDFASYEPIDARLEAAEAAMKAAITPATTGEEPTR